MLLSITIKQKYFFKKNSACGIQLQLIVRRMTLLLCSRLHTAPIVRGWSLQTSAVLADGASELFFANSLFSALDTPIEHISSTFLYFCLCTFLSYVWWGWWCHDCQCWCKGVMAKWGHEDHKQAKIYPKITAGCRSIWNRDCETCWTYSCCSVAAHVPHSSARCWEPPLTTVLVELLTCGPPHHLGLSQRRSGHTWRLSCWISFHLSRTERWYKI